MAVICSIRLVRLTAREEAVVLRTGRSIQITAIAEDHPHRGEVALRRRAAGASAARARSDRARRSGGRRARGVLIARRLRRGAVADVGAGDRGDDLLLRSTRGRRSSPATRPSRSTTIRSATSKTSARLWLITTTPSPRSRSRWISSRTCAVWATPSAAVGSSSSTTFGSPSSERATATGWRWPPESVRDLGADARGSSPPSCSSSSCASVLHPDLVELPREPCPGPATPPRWPRKRLATTSRLSHSARSW